MLPAAALGHDIATARRGERAHRIISALAPTDDHVAPIAGFARRDEAVNGAPFYVMGCVDGAVVRRRAPPNRSSPEDSQSRPGASIAQTLARSRRRPRRRRPSAYLGRWTDRIERQLKRWDEASSRVGDPRGPEASPPPTRRLRGRSRRGGEARHRPRRAHRLDRLRSIDESRRQRHRRALVPGDLRTSRRPLAGRLGLLMVWSRPGTALPGAARRRGDLLGGFSSRAGLVEAYECRRLAKRGRPRLLRGVRLLEAGAASSRACSPAPGPAPWARRRRRRRSVRRGHALLGDASLAALDGAGIWRRLYERSRPTVGSTEADARSWCWRLDLAPVRRIDRGADHLSPGLDTCPIDRLDARRAARPPGPPSMMHLVDGVNTGLSWPRDRAAGAAPTAGNGLPLLICGAGPDLTPHLEALRQARRSTCQEAFGADDRPADATTTPPCAPPGRWCCPVTIVVVGGLATSSENCCGVARRYRREAAREPS